MGYATGQFGKNHFGDLNKYLPTVHGFDEFYGNLYHLNAEEDPEDRDYPKDPRFREAVGPRGVLHCWATDTDDPTEQPRWGRVGKQKIEDTGPLTRKRMETCDDDFIATAKEWIRKRVAAGEPFFCWVNTTHMHFRTHTKPESLGQAGPQQSAYHDTMIDHDRNVGQLLDLLAELGVAEDTFVMYSTDNGPHMNSWPDGAMTPFRSEKDTNWEGAFRVPLLMRWPGKIPAGVVVNDIVQHHDWLPTFLAMAGEPDIVEKCKKGHRAGDKTFKVHIDGFNMLDFLTKEGVRSPRDYFFYFSDDGDLVALRHDNWKMVFAEQRCSGNPADLGRAVHAVARPQALQPAHRSFRARRHHLEHLLGLVRVQGLPDHGRPEGGRPVPGDVQGLPAPPEGGQLHHRPGDGEDGSRDGSRGLSGRPARALRAGPAQWS